MEIFNEWFTFSLILFGIWLIIFIFLNKESKKEMFYVSFFTMFFGLTEPFFVPEYWNPPSLLNLASRTGFDIESFIFSFAIGGIGAVLYELFFRVKHKKMNKHEMNNKRHRYHILTLLSAPIIFILLYLLTELNPIYSAIIAMFAGGISIVLCRPDLRKKTFIGGLLFLALYFLFFLTFNFVYPYGVEQFWNLNALSGILFLGIPLEELLFAFAFGMMWSGVYEQVKWYKIN